MNNLRPLKWTQKNLNPLAELELTAYSALHEYEITEPRQGKYELKKTRLSRPDKKSEFLENFDTVKEAKDWAWAHYQRSMQPYVKPMPTWIDVSERLPERKDLLTDKDKCLVLTECGKVWTGFYNMHIKPDDWYLHGWTEKQGWHPFKIVAWMLASEFSTMQNLHKGDK